MSTRSNILVVILALAACGKGKGGAAGGDECAATVEHMTSLQMAGMPKDLDESMKKKMAALMVKVNAAVAETCKSTKWSKEAISCLKGLKTAADAQKCDDKLTKEQKDAAEKAGEAAAEEAQKPSAEDKTAALKGITELRDQMCACKDAACGEEIYKKWGDVEKASEGARHDEPTKEAWEKIDDELMKCKSALK